MKTKALIEIIIIYSQKRQFISKLCFFTIFSILESKLYSFQ